MSFVTYLLIFAAVSVVQWWRSQAAVTETAEALRSQGLNAVNAKLQFWKGGRNSFYISFDAMTHDGALVTGHTYKFPFRAVQLNFDGAPPLNPRLQRMAEEPAGLELDESASLENRIMFEANQRLERLRGDREAFLANDLDGDGQVDSEEWDLVRERVVEEVRAEMTGVSEGGDEASPPPESPIAPEEEADVVVVEEQDGHW